MAAQLWALSQHPQIKSEFINYNSWTEPSYSVISSMRRERSWVVQKKLTIFTPFFIAIPVQTSGADFSLNTDFHNIQGKYNATYRHQKINHNVQSILH